MAFSTLVIIIIAMLLIGGLIGYFLNPIVNWCVHTIRRFYFRPRLLVEHKVKFAQPDTVAQPDNKDRQ